MVTVAGVHKWVCAPKGAAFLHTRADRLEQTFPVVVSHGWNTGRPGARYRALFDWVGTDDFSSWLVLPDFLELLGGLEPAGWSGLIERNHRLALAARGVLAAALQADPPVPEEMIGAMVALELPDAHGGDPGGIDSPLTGELIAAGFEAPAAMATAGASSFRSPLQHHRRIRGAGPGVGAHAGPVKGNPTPLGPHCGALSAQVLAKNICSACWRVSASSGLIP